MDEDSDFSSLDPPVVRNPSSGGGLGLAIGGLVVGGFAFVISFIPCFGAFAFWPGLFATVLSIVSLSTSESKTIPVIALCVSLVAVGMGYYWRNLIDQARDDLRKGELRNDRDWVP